MSDPAAYSVSCFSCETAFDALQASWCSCLVVERTLVCPKCLACFCKGSPAYKQKFWREAPKALWDRKFQEHASDEGPAANPAPEAVTRPLVLIVDDEKGIQKIAVRVVAGLGYGVILGTNGVEGLELARRYKPELVLTDALMPRLDGREMCKQIKNDPQLGATKVVVMTSLYTSSKYQTEGLRVFKADAYLAKPLDLTALTAVLQKHLG